MWGASGAWVGLGAWAAGNWGAAPTGTSAPQICQTLDWNSDGRITFAEFACAIRSVPELALTLEATLKPQSLPHWQYVPEAHCSSCAEPLQEVGGGFHCPKCSPTPETPKGRKLFGFIGT